MFAVSARKWHDQVHYPTNNEYCKTKLFNRCDTKNNK